MNSEEFIRVSNKYLNTVYKTAFCCYKNKADAEDAVQNTFLKLLNERTEFKDDEHIKRWLIRVVINECKNIKLSFWNRKKVSFEELESEPSYCKENSGELWTVISRLPQSYSTVIHLYYYEGYSVKEIAEILRISESNVQVRLMRARNKLKQFLQEV